MNRFCILLWKTLSEIQVLFLTYCCWWKAGQIRNEQTDLVMNLLEKEGTTLLANDNVKYIERCEEHERAKGEFFTFRLFQIFEQPQNNWLKFATIYQVGSSSFPTTVYAVSIYITCNEVFSVSSEIRSIYRTAYYFLWVSALSLRKSRLHVCIEFNQGRNITSSFKGYQDQRCITWCLQPNK